MFKSLTMALAITATLGGCAAVRESAVNPFNWFGRGQEEPTASDANTNPLIPRTRQGLFARARAQDAISTTTPIDQVTDLRIERVPGGAIIRATGLDPSLGSYNATLVPENEEENVVDGVLTYTFERDLPVPRRAGGTEASRAITVARFVSDQQLASARSIRVVAARNSRVARR